MGQGLQDDSLLSSCSAPRECFLIFLQVLQIAILKPRHPSCLLPRFLSRAALVGAAYWRGCPTERGCVSNVAEEREGCFQLSTVGQSIHCSCRLTGFVQHKECLQVWIKGRKGRGPLGKKSRVWSGTAQRVQWLLRSWSQYQPTQK